MIENEQMLTLIDNNLASLKLLHPRIKAIQCWPELLSGCSTLSCFVGKIESKVKKIKKMKEPNLSIFDKCGEDGANSFKGDAFEVFSEYLLISYGRLFGVNNYTPFFITGEEQDTGVDGIGYTKDGRVVTVQIKYGNWQEKLDYFRRRLHTFHWTSIRKYQIDKKSLDQMFIVTLAREIDYRTLDQFFHGRLRFITQITSGFISNHTNKPVQIISIKDICDKHPMFFNTMLHLVSK